MTLNQLTDYIIIIGIIIVAVASGVDTALSFYIKRASELKKPVPQQLMTIDEIAKFVVSEAATLDVSGAEKKMHAVQALLDQAKAEGKPITEPVARGAVQHAYDKTQIKPTESTDAETKQIGFLDDNAGDDSNESKEA